MKASTKESARLRIRRLEGQIRGIGKMVQDDAYCIDVLTQLQAVSAACESLGLMLLDDHVRTCVADAVRSGDGTEKMDELSAAVRRFARR
ncbi:MAG: metal-sensitive transcriptional regulator [Actinobacteria bacterium]|nr:MAG: metal-sensitive transcriptional regulator [Actinomycetota bacterium]